MECVFCREDGGEVLWKDEKVRVVLAAEPDYPGFCRVIWHAHAAEFTDLTDTERTHLMRVVGAVERAVRQVMQPDKVNLASLGNQVPHVHWHVIPRYRNDAHFPQPVWAPRQRSVSEPLLRARAAQATLLRHAVCEAVEHAVEPRLL